MSFQCGIDCRRHRGNTNAGLKKSEEHDSDSHLLVCYLFVPAFSDHYGERLHLCKSLMVRKSTGQEVNHAHS